MAGYNLSCIVTLPIYQRKGYGFFLISFSYLLSRRENRLGSPEKPLSDLGLLSYRSYWKTTLAHELLHIIDNGENTSVQDLGRRTGMTDDDVVSGLEGLDALVKDPETGIFAIRVNREKLVERVDAVSKKGYLKIRGDLLKWTPYLLGRKEARDMLEGGLRDLISQQRERTSSAGSEDVLMVNGGGEEVQGGDVPVERFVSVAVRDLVPLPPVMYDRTEPQTPTAIDLLATPSSPGSPSPSSSSSDDDDDEEVDPNVSPSAIEEDVSDEPSDEDGPSSSAPASDSESSSSSEFSSDSEDERPTSKPARSNRSRLTRSSSASQTTSSVRHTPEVAVIKKAIAKAPRGRVGARGEVVKPKVIVAKAPRSRAGRNPPEVMSRRSSLRHG
jgi:histone acetyltransferase SAS3